MEVLLRRRCCVGCNTEAVTSPQPPPLAWVDGRPFRKHLTLFYCIFITCFKLVHGPHNRPKLFMLGSLNTDTTMSLGFLKEVSKRTRFAA